MLCAAVAAEAQNDGRFVQDRFAIGFWVDPPAELITDARYKEIADANFTFVLGAFGPKTVKDIVEEGVAETAALLKQYEDVSNKLSDPDADFDALLEKQAALQEKIDHANAWDLESRLEQAMDALRCPPGDTAVSVLSGGERRRVALCRLLLQNPDVLLLDEPAGGVSAADMSELGRLIRSWVPERTVLLVEHHMELVMEVCDLIWVLDAGKVIASGTPDEVRNDPAVLAAYLGQEGAA